MATLDLTSLRNALLTLHEALQARARNPDDKFIRDACIQRFEYNYELSHKTLRRYLMASEPSASEVAEMDFAGLIRLAFARGLIASEWKAWRRYRDARNLTSHAYDEAKAIEVLAVIPDFCRDADEILANIDRAQGQTP